MRAVLPGKPPAKLQALSTVLWDGLRVVAYISGNAIAILGGAQDLLQTIYVDDTDSLEAVAIDEASGKIAVCGGRDIFVYHAYRIKDEPPKWSLAQSFHSEEDDEPVETLSWGSPDELLVGNSRLTLWFLTDSPYAVWTNKLANPVKFAQFSADAGLVATTGHYDRMVKIWRRLAFGADDVRFEVFYLRHPATVTGIHWRNPYHREQNMDNLLYTICADNKIRIWAPIRAHSRKALQLWGEIDMSVSIQPRHPQHERKPARRYCFIIDSRDFSAATERAVERDNRKDTDKPALEHLIDVANRGPEVCVVLDGNGHMSAWGLENAGCRVRKEDNIFNIVHVEGLNLPFARGILPEEDYVQFHTFSGASAEDSFTILAHCFDGRIEWFDSKVDVLFDPNHHKRRLTSRGKWSGHSGPIKKVIRNASGRALVSRTNDNLGLVWKQKTGGPYPSLVRRSTLFSEEHIHRTTLIGDGKFLVNLHHRSISLWDTSSFHAERLAICEFDLGSKPLCVLLIPTTEENASTAYVAAIGANMRGITWEVDITDAKNQVNGTGKVPHWRIRQFSSFTLGLDDDLAYVLPVDPAGSQVKISGFLDLFAADIALSYTHSGTVRTWTAKVDREKNKIDWLCTSTVETGISNISLASGSSIRKAALVGQDRTHLSIWDTSDAQLEFEEHFSQEDVIRDLDWTSTPDIQSILAVGFPHKVILMSQLRYDYLDAGPSWAQIREIRTRDLTPHPIGDSCWLDNGNLVIGAGNQLFIYDKHIEASHHLVSDLRLSLTQRSYVDLFDAVGRLNGSLPVFHPQFLAQCILAGKTALVHRILMSLHRKLKFFSEGDEIDGFLDLPLEVFYRDSETPPEKIWKERQSPEDSDDDDDEYDAFDEEVASIMNENLTKVALPQLSSKEQFRLVDTIECVATVEKHRRSMDRNAARYLLFFRQHMLRKSQGLPERITIPWREIVWAFHSDSQDILADLVTRQFNGKMLWEHARESGIFMWMTDLSALTRQLEVIARNEYTKTDEKNPIDCTLYYIALKKKNVLQGLWRMATWNREQAATQRLLAHDFEEPRWKTAALKNAFALLGKRRFEYAAAFFLLAGHLRDAAYVCINQLEDVQLAIAITRAYEGDDGPVLKEIIEEKILPESATEGDRWLATWAFWMLNRRDMAVRSLITPVSSLIPPTPASPGSPGTINIQSKSFLSNDPALVVLYKQLREKTLQTLKGASKVPAREEWEFVLRNARLYDRMGCDLLALDLVRHWEFLRPQPSDTNKLSLKLMNGTPDPQKILRRRSSLVIADMPLIDSALQKQQQQRQQKDGEAKSPTGTRKPPPTVFEEPAANSLLDNFGF